MTTIDWHVIEELRALSDGDEPEFFETQVTLFTRRGGDLLDKLELAAAAGNMHALGAAAHALSGSAGVIGAARLSRLSLEAERASPGWSMNQAGREATRLRVEFERVAGLLRAEVVTAARRGGLQ